MTKSYKLQTFIKDLAEIGTTFQYASITSFFCDTFVTLFKKFAYKLVNSIKFRKVMWQNLVNLLKSCYKINGYYLIYFYFHIW